MNAILMDEIFRLAFFELGAGVNEDNLALARFRFLAIKNDDGAGRGGVVEKIVGEQDHAFDRILFDEPFADFLFAVFGLVAAAARDRAGVEHDSGASIWFERGERVLQPGPIGFAGGDAALFLEPAERVVFINRFIEGLVPHRIGHDDVEFFQAGVGVAELWICH